MKWNKMHGCWPFWYLVKFNSLAPGRFEWNFRHVIFKQILVIDGWVISCEIALLWMSWDFTDDQSTLVQVMAWCRQATSHYLNQCWPRSLLPNGVTRPQWVNWAGYFLRNWNWFVKQGVISLTFRELSNIISQKTHNTENHIHGENFKLKLCTCAQSHALGTPTKFQLEFLIRTTISAIHKFQENILESSWNDSETTPRLPC